MKSKVGSGPYQIVWNKLPQKRLKLIYNYIKYKKLEPLSAERLRDELIDFGDQIAESPGIYVVLKELSNDRFEYRTANYKKCYRFIFRVNEKKKHIIITNLFHNKRDPKKLKKY